MTQPGLFTVPCPADNAGAPCVLPDLPTEHVLGHETDVAGADRRWGTTTTDEARWAHAEQFAVFHAANPHVYDTLRILALDLVRRGRRRIGIGMLFEVLRWKHEMTTDDPTSTFKLNNNYRSAYARLLAANEPELRAVFEFRALHASDRED